MSDLLPWMAPWSAWLSTWLLALALFVFGSEIARRGLRRRRFNTPHCPSCAYNLTGTLSETCPECGKAVADRTACFYGRRRKKLILIGLTVAIALPVFAVQRRVRQYGWIYYTYYGPIYWVSPTRVTNDETYGPFRVRTYSDRRPWEPDVVIRIDPGNLRIKGIRRWNHSIHHGGKDPGWQGMDINNNGRPDLVLEAGWFPHDRDIRWYELVDGRVTLIERYANTDGYFVNTVGPDLYTFNADSDNILRFDPAAKTPALFKMKKDTAAPPAP